MHPLDRRRSSATDLEPRYASSRATNFGIQVAVDPQGNAVVYSGGDTIQHGILRRFDATGAVVFSTDVLPGAFPNLAIDATGNIYVTGSAVTLAVLPPPAWRAAALPDLILLEDG